MSILLLPDDSYRRRRMPSLIVPPAAPAITDNGNWGQPLSSTLRVHSDMLGLSEGQILKGVAASSALANPADAPVLTPGTSGFIPNGTYTVGYVYLGIYGETLLSPTASIVLSGGPTNSILTETLTVPTGTTQVKWFMSVESGSSDLRLAATHGVTAFSLTALPAADGAIPLVVNNSGSVAHAEKATMVGGTGMEVVLSESSVTFNYNPSNATDQNGFILRRLRIENFPTVGLPNDLGPSDKGRMVYDTTVLGLKIWNGTDWIGALGDVGEASGTVSGDLNGSLPNPTVIKIQGIDVSNTSPSDGQVLSYNSGASRWQPTTFVPNGNAISLRGRPISTATPTTGQALIYNGTSYVPQTIVSSSGNATTVANIPVSVVAPTPGQILVYDGTAYVPSDIVSATGNANSIGGIGVTSDTPNLGDVLTYDGVDWAPAAPGGSGSDASTIQGEPVSATAPSDGDVLTYNSGTWAPAPGGSDATTIQGETVDATAPSEGDVLTYSSGTWGPAAPGGGGSGGGINPNILVNSSFDIRTRGTSLSFAGPGDGNFNSTYDRFAPRWQIFHNGGTTDNISFPYFNLSSGTGFIGWDPTLPVQVQRCARFEFANPGGSADAIVLKKLLVHEDLGFANRGSVVVSFYAKADTAGTFKLNFNNNFTNTNLSVTTSWTRFSHVYDLGSAFALGYAFGLPLLATIDLAFPTGTNVFYTTAWKLESGVTMTDYERPAGGLEAAACARWYRNSYNTGELGTQVLNGALAFTATKDGAVSQVASTGVSFGTQMVSTPVVTLFNPVTASNNDVANITQTENCTSTAATHIGEGGFGISFTGSSGTLVGDEMLVHWEAECEPNTGF